MLLLSPAALFRIWDAWQQTNGLTESRKERSARSLAEPQPNRLGANAQKILVENARIGWIAVRINANADKPAMKALQT